jgi:hypothetical protein
MQPQLLSHFFAAPTGDLPTELQPLVRGDDWQQRFSPELAQSNETAGVVCHRLPVAVGINNMLLIGCV